MVIAEDPRRPDPSLIISWSGVVSYTLQSFSILGNKYPHFGELFFTEDAYKLELRTKIEEGAAEGGMDENGKTKKIINLEGNKQSHAVIYS